MRRGSRSAGRAAAALLAAALLAGCGADGAPVAPGGKATPSEPVIAVTETL